MDGYAKPSANTESSNIEDQGYEVSVKWKNGNPTVSGTDTNNDTVNGVINKLDTRYYNQFTNTRTTLADDVRTELKVKKVVDGYEWGSEYYNMRLAAGNATYSDNEAPATGTSPMPSATSVNIYDITTDHTLSFGNVLFTRPGTYKYTITEYDNSVNMPQVSFASPVEVTITVVTGEDGELHISAVSDNSGVDNNSVLVPAAQDGSTLQAVITTMTNRSKGLDLEKVDGATGRRIDGAVFELHTGNEKLYFDSNMKILTAAQVLEQIEETSISSDAAIAKMQAAGITSTFTMGKVSLKNFTLTGYTLDAGAFVPDTPVVYELVEISAPTGYVITENNSYFKIVGVRDETETSRVRYTGMEIHLTDENGQDLVDDTGALKTQNKNVSLTGNKLQITITNNTGAELPSTGGPGTATLYLLGLMLLALSGAGLALRKII